MPKLNILNELIVYLYSFASTMNKFLIRKSLVLQDSYSKQIHIDLKNFLSNPRLGENVSSFHDEIRRTYIQSGSCHPLGHDFLEKEISGALH